MCVLSSLKINILQKQFTVTIYLVNTEQNSFFLSDNFSSGKLFYTQIEEENTSKDEKNFCIKNFYT